MKLSIITINYNNVIGLDNTIKSVKAQSYSDFEFVVIDGGSTDGSVDVIRGNEETIDFWVSERDGGIYNAMNKGVTYAHGEYCLFLNSGDCFYDCNVLSRVVDKGLSEDIIVGKVAIDLNDNIISPPPASGELTFYHLYSGAIPHQGSFIRTELLRKYPYDENLRIASDWKFFVQTLIFDSCSIRYINEFISRYDLDGISTSNPELMRKEKEMIMTSLLPPRILADYRNMKKSECMTMALSAELRNNYGVDRILYYLGRFLLKIRKV